MTPNLFLSANYVSFSGAYYYLQSALHFYLVWVQNLGWQGVIFFIMIYVTAAISLIPGSILTLGAGAIYGVGWGSLYVLIGAVIGETAAFLLGRYFARDWITRKIAANKLFFALNRALKENGLKIILLTRLSPIFPFSLLNYALGLTGISLKDYFLGSIGMIPMTITYVYFGSLAEDLASLDAASGLVNTNLQWSIKILGFAVTVAATVYITHTARQNLARLIELPQSNS